MSDIISTASKLEKVIGKTPGPRDLKVIDHLDDHAIRWISVSTCMFVCLYERNEGIFATIAGGTPGFVDTNKNAIKVSLDTFDHPERIKKGSGWGSLFLTPTLNETLRVNGVVESVDNGVATVKVVECFLHCAKALLRSHFWQPANPAADIDTVESFMNLTNFMLVASSDETGQADISPKGDMPGKLLCQHNQSIWYPERPGNRRVDGYRNMLSQPKIEILALVPGSAQVLRLSGSVNLSTNDTIRKSFAVKDKVPCMVTEIHSQTVSIESSAAMEKAALWPAQAPGITLKGAEIFKAHIQLSKLKGVQATVAKKAVTIPGAFEKALEFDYKKNQY